MRGRGFRFPHPGPAMVGHVRGDGQKARCGQGSGQRWPSQAVRRTAQGF